MRFRSLLFLVMIGAMCASAFAVVSKNARLVHPDVKMDDATVPAIQQPPSPGHHPARNTLDDPIGSVDTAGWTWYDEQQWTTCGKQIAVDDSGYVHHVWTNGLQSGSAQRHVYYNAWSPLVSAFIIPSAEDPLGWQVDNADRAGYANIAVNGDGLAYVAYHQTANGQPDSHTAVALDYRPHYGVFNAYVVQYPDPASRRVAYPKISCDIDGHLQLTATQGVTSSVAYNSGFYAKGIPMGDTVNWGGGFTFIDSTEFLTRDIATSIHGNRVAMAWLWYPSVYEPWYGPNVYLRTSDDGGATWNDPVNITNYPSIDSNCVHDGGDMIQCNQDTLRPYADLSIMFDQNDVVHIAFTTRWWGAMDETGAFGPWIHNDDASSIWHWDELHQEFNIVAERWYGTLTYSPGATQLMCHRPSLAVDTTTGYLYCSYQMYDTTQYSDMSYEQADAYVSVSTTGGRTWSAGTDVTNTNGGQNATAGNSRSERDINIAKFVTGGVIHMQYQLDLDAGTAINSNAEGTPTYNPICYQRIPVDLIPLRPLINPYRAMRFDSTGYPHDLDTNLAVTEHPTLQPGRFALYQNYPNPFNPTTTIQFDLGSNAVVTLKVFDVLGREVATLFDKQRLSAGVQMVSFDASGLSSGVYFYCLETPKMTQTRKMIVMK
jgi:hypothetical protein